MADVTGIGHRTCPNCKAPLRPECTHMHPQEGYVCDRVFEDPTAKETQTVPEDEDGVDVTGCLFVLGLLAAAALGFAATIGGMWRMFCWASGVCGGGR